MEVETLTNIFYARESGDEKAHLLASGVDDVFKTAQEKEDVNMLIGMMELIHKIPATINRDRELNNKFIGCVLSSANRDFFKAIVEHQSRFFLNEFFSEQNSAEYVDQFLLAKTQNQLTIIGMYDRDESIFDLIFSKKLLNYSSKLSINHLNVVVFLIFEYLKKEGRLSPYIIYEILACAAIDLRRSDVLKYVLGKISGDEYIFRKIFEPIIVDIYKNYKTDDLIFLDVNGVVVLDGIKICNADYFLDCMDQYMVISSTDVVKNGFIKYVIENGYSGNKEFLEMIFLKINRTKITKEMSCFILLLYRFLEKNVYGKLNEYKTLIKNCGCSEIIYMIKIREL